MGRQPQQGQGQKSGGDLLNFHFSSGPPPQQQQNNGRRRNQNHNQYSNHNYNRRRNQQDRSSARRKPNSNMFNLHASADHAFVITRHGLKQQQYSFSGSDEAVSWESVRMVKHLVPGDSTCCPICLGELICSRITKCGHYYCLPCLLRHVQVHAQTNPYAHVKCPCCVVPLHVTDLRPVLLTTSLAPQLHQCIKLIKLHRTKDCSSPYLPLPEAPKRSSSHAAPCMTDEDAPFCRFNYIDCNTYQEHLAANKVELEMELADLLATKHQPQQNRTSQQSQFHQQKYQTDVEAIFVTSSLDVVQKEIQKAMEEYSQEQDLADTFAGVGSGVYQQQPQPLVASHYEFTKLPLPADADAAISEGMLDNSEGRPRRQSVGSESDTRSRLESVGSEGESVARRYRGDSISSYASVESGAAQNAGLPPNSPGGQPKNRGKRNKAPKQFPKASMYLDNEGSSHFYQSSDGQLCFLSRFNMSCLMTDFSRNLPDDLDSLAATADSLNYWRRRKLLPLLDTVEGEILEIESVQLTPDMRKRMPFLAHLPLYMDIHFVELDLNNLLSMECKKKFRAELEKRRKRRQIKVKAEKREDKMARKKEEERINELKARMQQIDPNDEFFQVSLPEEPVDLTGDAFGPAIAGNGAEPTAETAAVASSQPTFSFSNVCQLGGASSVMGNAEQNFPALGSSPPSKSGSTQAAPTWGSPSRSAQSQPSWGQPKPSPSWGSQSKPNPAPTPVAADPRPAEVSKQQPMPGSKKKNKGKKIVLFSTGGQRGGAF